jgi:hypothetical protein
VAWTTPITFVTGNQLLAAQLNTYLRDNTNYLFAPPMCLAQATATSTITTNTGTNVSFAGTDLYDTDTMHDNAGSPTLIKPNTAGVYLWTTDVQFVGNATGIRWVQINGAAFIAGNGITATPMISHQSELGPIATISRLSATGFYRVSAADITNGASVSVTVFQNSGGNLSLNGTGAASAPCYFAARWCGPYP